MEKDIRMDLLSHISRSHYPDIQKIHTEQFLTSATTDAQQISTFYTSILITLISGSASFVFALVYGFITSWKLTTMILLISPILLIVGRILMPLIQKHANEERTDEENARACMQEQFGQIPYIKINDAYFFQKTNWRNFRTQKRKMA